MYRRIGIIVALVAFACARLFALDDASPGRNLEGIRLGMPRLAACKLILDRNNYGAGWKHSAVHRYTGGLLEDDLDLHSDGSTIVTIEILSKNGMVFQISRVSDNNLPQTNYTFARLTKEHPLQERTYELDWPDGGSIDGYYFDDVKHGVCFVGQSQDVFFLTAKPDTIIVHKIEVPVVPISLGVKGTLVQGENGRVYLDDNDYSKRLQHDMNDY